MADIVIVIPNDQVGRAIDALCTLGGYSGDPADKPARREFARTVVAQYIRRAVLQVERQEAAAAAMSSVVVNPIEVA